MIDIDGRDVTDYFIRGAEQAWRLAHIFGAKGAIFKDGSPSCGIDTIYNGRFKKKMIRGCGVTTALLTGRGLAVVDGSSIIGMDLFPDRHG